MRKGDEHAKVALGVCSALFLRLTSCINFAYIVQVHDRDVFSEEDQKARLRELKRMEANVGKGGGGGEDDETRDEEDDDKADDGTEESKMEDDFDDDDHYDDDDEEEKKEEIEWNPADIYELDRHAWNLFLQDAARASDKNVHGLARFNLSDLLSLSQEVAHAFTRNYRGRSNGDGDGDEGGNHNDSDGDRPVEYVVERGEPGIFHSAQLCALD